MLYQRALQRFNILNNRTLVSLRRLKMVRCMVIGMIMIDYWIINLWITQR